MWTFGRTVVETAPARPDEIACVASGVVAKRCSASAAGQRAPETERRGVPHLDDRRSPDVEPHERAPADLVDDGVREHQHDALAGGGRGDRRGAAAVGRDVARATAMAGEEAPVASPGSSSGGADEPALARQRARARSRAAPPAGAPARRRGSSGSAGTGRRRRRRRRPAPGRARCRRGGAPAPPRTIRRRRGLDGDLERLVAGGEELDQRADVLGDERRRQHRQPARLAARLGHRAARLLGQPEDLASPAPRAAGRRGVSAMPRPLRTNSSSPSSFFSADTATETAGSVTSSSAAAALTDRAGRRARRTAAERGS